MSNIKAKLVLITGPPGCGKNTLIDLYSKKIDAQIIRYKEESDSQFIYDALEIKRDFSANSYP